MENSIKSVETPIKVSDLMCGDIVLCDERPVRIYGIMEKMNRLYDEFTNDISIGRCKGIKLTFDILHNNGWRLIKESFGDVWCYDAEHFHIEIQCNHKMIVWYDSDGEYDINPDNKLPCPETVHELQNSLRSLKLNELADNFVV